MPVVVPALTLRKLHWFLLEPEKRRKALFVYLVKSRLWKRMPYLTRRFILLALLLGILACGVLLPGLGGGFIFDDLPNIVRNGNLRIGGGGMEDLLYAAYSYNAGHSRALSMLSLALDLWRGGLDPQVFKTTNLCIHALTTVVLALFFRRLLAVAQWPARRAAVGALVMAAAWAIHPLQVSSVLYVVQRMQTLCTLFVVASLWAYLAMRQAQIQGERSRHFGLLTVFFGILAFASKEDAVLLPVYALALELTVLHLRATSPALAKTLRIGYAGLVAAGLAAYLLLVIPHYWHWDAYPGRDFSTSERLLTQGRVLVMYLGQIVLPLPKLLPFYYDDLAISRGWLQPLTTLPAWFLVVTLLAWAWRWRSRAPLFSLGVLLFFAGHFLTSNVVNVELAFEHRNHFPLIGVVLAVAGLLNNVRRCWATHLPVAATVLGLVLAAEATVTVVRAHAWGEPLRFAQTSVDTRPSSARAWLALCGAYFERSGGKPHTAEMQQAIQVCERGAHLTHSPQLLSNVVIFKTLEGTVVPADWTRFLTALRAGATYSSNQGIALITLDNLDRGIPLDESGVIQTFDLITEHAMFPPEAYLRMGDYIYNKSQQPERALHYLQLAVEESEPDDPRIDLMLTQLEQAGRSDWVAQLAKLRVRRERKN